MRGGTRGVSSKERTARRRAKQIDGTGSRRSSLAPPGRLAGLAVPASPCLTSPVSVPVPRPPGRPSPSFPTHVRWKERERPTAGQGRRRERGQSAGGNRAENGPASRAEPAGAGEHQDDGRRGRTYGRAFWRTERRLTIAGVGSSPVRILFESRPQFPGGSGRDRSTRHATAQLHRLFGGPGVTSPKSRPSGCRADHAGNESFPSVLPDPFGHRRPAGGTRRWRRGA